MDVDGLQDLMKKILGDLEVIGLQTVSLTPLKHLLSLGFEKLCRGAGKDIMQWHGAKAYTEEWPHKRNHTDNSWMLDIQVGYVSDEWTYL